MIECIKFIFGLFAEFLKMLFTIDLGNGMSLGMFMCVIFIFLPTVLILINFLKHADDIELFEMFRNRRNKGD